MTTATQHASDWHEHFTSLGASMKRVKEQVESLGEDTPPPADVFCPSERIFTSFAFEYAH
jgi:hypothetical protein